MEKRHFICDNRDMGTDTNEANVGYAVLDGSGLIVASNSVFNGWLGTRALKSLLPDLEIRESAALPTTQTRLCPADEKSCFAEVEFTRLEGARDSSAILRIRRIGQPSAEHEYRDVVTGLPDRRALAVHRARWQQESAGVPPHALLFLDLDNFKQINDSLGHATGDKVLAVLAERWQKSLRGKDLIVRYGGDEFVAMLAGVGSHGETLPIIDRLKRATVAPIQIGDDIIELSVTIGVAIAVDETVSLEELLVLADKAMYASKKKGS